MTELLFSYGTLQKAEVQIELFGRILNGTKDMLKGYRMSSVEITDEAFLARGEEKHQFTLIPTNNENDIIEGTVFKISERELLLAHRYEPVSYERIKVELESGKKAWIYIVSNTSLE